MPPSPRLLARSPRARLVVAAAAAAVAAAGLLTACSPQTTVMTSDASQQRTVNVSATGQADAVPDAARAFLTVEITDPGSAQTAQEQAAAATTKVIDALKAKGVDEKDIATQAISVGPAYNYTQGGGQEQIGYRASQSIQVTMRDLTTAGATLDSVVAAAGNAARIDSLTPYVTDPTVAAKAARAQAVQIAQAQAEQYASLLGFTLGPVASVSEQTTNAPPPVALSDAAGAAPEGKVSTPVQPGTTQVSVSLAISWTIAE